MNLGELILQVALMFCILGGGNRDVIIDSTDILFRINLDKKFYDDRILEEMTMNLAFLVLKANLLD